MSIRTTLVLGTAAITSLATASTSAGSTRSIADWNKDGAVTVTDYIAFNRDFQAGNADLNRDGETNVQDFVLFIKAFNEDFGL